MSALIAFEFQGNAIRTVMINNRPHWVAVDIAGVLGYAHAPHMVRLVPDHQKAVHQLPVRQMDRDGVKRNLTVLTEGGVYRCVMSSERPEAEAFVDWLTDEVLPSLRSTGRYEMPGADSGLDEIGDGSDLLEDLTFERAMSLLHAARLIHGKRAAARVWSHIGLPDISERAEELAFADAAIDPAYACINGWLSARCDFVPGHQAQSSALYADYRLWCQTNGVACHNVTRFGLHLRRRGLKGVKKGCIWRVGLLLKPVAVLVA